MVWERGGGGGEGGGGRDFYYILFCSCVHTLVYLLRDFSLGGGGGGGNISVRQHFRTRHWDLYCMFWSIM